MLKFKTLKQENFCACAFSLAVALSLKTFSKLRLHLLAHLSRTFKPTTILPGYLLAIPAQRNMHNT